MSCSTGQWGRSSAATPRLTSISSSFLESGSTATLMGASRGCRRSTTRLPPPGEVVLAAAGGRRVVRQLIGAVGPEPQVLRVHPQLRVPPHPLRQPVLVPLGCLGRWAEELQLPLLELAGAEDELAGGDLVAEGLADLGDSEGRAHPGGAPP